MPTVTEIDALLPQTQCGDCGYAGCRPYAEALAAGLAPLDRCPPGGVTTLKALGHLLKVDVGPFVNAVEQATRSPALAVIRESECIGCTKCIQACPVDAIIGSAKHMHTVLPDECTGCGLCVEPCPVDCIDMLAVTIPAEQAHSYDPTLARSRFQAKQIRALQQEHARQQQYQNKRRLAKETTDVQHDMKAKQAYILAALKRVGDKKGE